jgi:hypothetical protein
VGRKLNFIEAASTAFSDASSAQSPTLLSRSQLLQEQIAQQLGISPNEFRKEFTEARIAQMEDTPAAVFNVALSRECLELLEVYCRIADPKLRHRCLQVVREAADAVPATEA